MFDIQFKTLQCDNNTAVRIPIICPTALTRRLLCQGANVCAPSARCLELGAYYGSGDCALSAVSCLLHDELRACAAHIAHMYDIQLKTLHVRQQHSLKNTHHLFEGYHSAPTVSERGYRSSRPRTGRLLWQGGPRALSSQLPVARRYA